MTRTHTVTALALAVAVAGAPGLSAQRAQPRQPVYDQNSVAADMSGTYALDAARSADPERAARTATNPLPAAQRTRAYQTLLMRLEPPETLSIERRGRTVTISSSRGPGASFQADGRVQNERRDDGRTVATRADIVGSQLRVTTTGRNREDNVTLTIDSVNNGDGLRVTRRLDDNQLRAPVSIQSYYQRTTNTPSWDVYNRGRGYGRNSGNTRTDGGFGRSTGSFYIPDGTRLIATLDTPISMRDSRSGQPFTMTVTGPNEYQGARIDGTLSRVNANTNRQSQSQDGRDLRLDFRTMTLRGRQSDFNATLEAMRLPDGTDLRTDREGSVQSSNDTGTNVRNGAIGAAIGAVVGAVVGGNKEAAIGAVVGGVGGVVGGMILSQGHEQLDIPRGTDITLTTLAQ